jgi:hypothetical protein
MSNSTTNSTGLPPPTKQGHIGSPAQAAYNDRQQQNISQAALANSVGGGKKKKGGAITVPVLQTSYKTTGSPAQSPTGIAANNGRVASQGNENAKYDNQLQQGGKRCKRGGNPDWLWGCYSGGKKRKTLTNKRKTRRYRKKTRRNKK